ncbi:hypothetical protein KR038_010730 [Drosophila bunnanda]|nr:hypothetical protein KR038_010730 [Drosophila bunnanda]
MRLVLDFRKLNERTIPDRYPMPNISMILGNLGKAKYFTTLDLKSGYHQITLAERDREKTSFSVNGGKYEFRRLPFGLKNAASIFQRTIDDIRREQIGKFCYVYVDDVIVFSEDENAHIRHVDWVLKSLHDANMRVSAQKSRFFKKNVSFLGFIVTNKGATTDPEKTKAIQEFPEPKNVFEVRSFLGLASYYRRFIKDFASIARPISEILKGEHGSISRHRSKNIQVQFSEQQRLAFHKLRNILALEDVILSYPDYKKAFDLTTDASAHGIGAVLSQEGRPITMISRTLKDREVNYATNERELTIEDLKSALLLLMNVFPKAKVIYCDNEPSLNSHTILTMLENHFGVSVSNAPPLHSASNGQVERFHSTLVELARCLKIDKGISDTVELILLATARYNKSIHSVIDKRPADVVQDKIRIAQDKLRSRENASRQNRVFEVGEKVLVKSNRRLGNKLSPLWEEKVVKADMGTTVLIKGRVVHKDNLR